MVETCVYCKTKKVLTVNTHTHTHTYTNTYILHGHSKLYKPRLHRSFYKVIEKSFTCLRPYHVESTSSHLNTEVKQRRASVVLGWETARELLVLQTFYFFLFLLFFISFLFFFIFFYFLYFFIFNFLFLY